MGIEKMRYVSFVGRKAYLDPFIQRYVRGDFEMQPEYAMGVLTNIPGLYACKENAPGAELLHRCEQLMHTLGVDGADGGTGSRGETAAEDTYASLQARMEEMETHVQDTVARRTRIREEIGEKQQIIGQMSRILDMDVELSALRMLRFFKVCFGRLPTSNYTRLLLYADTLDVILLQVSSGVAERGWENAAEPDHTYIVYITPTEQAAQVEGLLNSLLFEGIPIPEDLRGTPKTVCAELNSGINELQTELERLEKEIVAYGQHVARELCRIHGMLRARCSADAIRKYVAFSRESFYLVGWMPDSVFRRIRPRIEHDDQVILLVDNTEGLPASVKPPTKLQNNAIFRPFETVVTMYGLPAHDEIDPTPFIAVIYSLMTGFMFGDVGQGLVFFLAGLVLLRRKSALGGIFTGGGLMAMVFGFLYGSIFSLEHVLPPLFMNPTESANINTMLTIGIGMGVVLLVLGMLLNICNGIKTREAGRVLFHRNGLAGLVFYLLIVGSALYFLLRGRLWTSAGILAALLLVPFLLMFLKEPLENRLAHKKTALPTEKGTFLIETAFEMVDMLLSFASNTISFVRLSAFAINHVGLSMAVLILAEMPGSPVGRTAVLILGNVLIVVLEGLIVGIQGLRLVYYELFGRFYSGDGKMYEPIRRIS